MGTYRKEWDCCGSATETEAWEPDTCPFCTPVEQAQRAAAANAGFQAGREPYRALLAALDAHLDANDYGGLEVGKHHSSDVTRAIEAARAALSAPPVAWMNPDESFVVDAFIWSRDPQNPRYRVPVYDDRALSANAGTPAEQPAPASTGPEVRPLDRAAQTGQPELFSHAVDETSVRVAWPDGSVRLYVAARELDVEAERVRSWQERCDWQSSEPATKLMVQAMKAEIAELRTVLATRFRAEGGNTSNEGGGEVVARSSETRMDAGFTPGGEVAGALADEAKDAALRDALNTTLWLYRRLPFAYGKPPFVDEAILTMAKHLDMEDVPIGIKERAALMAHTKAQEK